MDRNSIGNIIGVSSMARTSRLMTQRQTILTGLILVILSFQALVLVILALFPYIPDLGLSNLNMSIYTFLVPLSTVFLLGLLYAWLIKLGIREARRYSTKFNRFFQLMAEPFRQLRSFARASSLPDRTQTRNILSRPRVMLGISVAASIFLGIVAYRPDINPSGSLVGIDTPLYALWVGQMLQRPVLGAIEYAFVQASDGSRPLSLLFPYATSRLFGASADFGMRVYPIFLGPLLAISAFVFVARGQGDERKAAFASLMTSLSFQITIGLWAGFYANWLALAEAYFLLSAILNFSKSNSRSSLFVALLLSLAILFTHPWTWDFMIVLCALFLFRQSLANRDVRIARLAIVFLTVNVLIDIVRFYALNASGTGIAGLDTITKGVDLSQVVLFWPNVVVTLVQYYAQLMAESVVLGLAMIAIWRLVSVREGFSRLLVLWVILGSLPFPFLPSLLQARIVYLLPIPILASAGAIGLQRLGQNAMQKSLILLLVLLLSANYAISAVLSL